MKSQSRKIFEEAPHFYYNRPIRQFIQTSARFDVGGFVCRNAVISQPSFDPPPTQLQNALLTLSPFMLSQPLIHCQNNRASVKIVLFPIT